MITLESFILAIIVINMVASLFALMALQLSTETGTETSRILGWVALVYAIELICIIIFAFS